MSWHTFTAWWFAATWWFVAILAGRLAGRIGRRARARATPKPEDYVKWLLEKQRANHLWRAEGDAPKPVSPPCSQAGCPNYPARPVVTDYGYLGDLCETHYAELASILERPGGDAS